MAKKKIVPQLEKIIEKVYSDKYRCNLTKKNAIYDEEQESWINLDIEKVLNKNRPIGDI